MATVKFNRTAIDQVLANALEGTVKDLGVRYRVAIESPHYSWPNRTLRQSGELAGTQRNIVDLGTFRDSQEVEFINPFLAEFSWNTPYAASIFFGYTTRTGNSFPARNPVEKAHQLDLPIMIFGENVRRFAA